MNVNRIKRNLTSDDVILRIITTYICFLFVFFTVTIVSYYLLPQGLLLNKHPLKNWDTSPALIISSLQILSFNLLSVVVILFGNTFLARKNKSQCFMPLGYLAFFAGIILNAVVLGTWSFSVVTGAIPLIDRLIGTFDLFHRSGLWEMSGQLFILCATVNISLIITDGKETTTKSWKTIKLSKQEIILFSIGLVLMLLGALIESYAIINLN
ncbi:MAG: hypothetical protein N2B06_13720 [Clostridium sp.]